jgi:hypothetical protein
MHSYSHTRSPFAAVGGVISNKGLIFLCIFCVLSRVTRTEVKHSSDNKSLALRPVEARAKEKEEAETKE